MTSTVINIIKSDYGAVEIKEFINKHTIRGFVSTMILLLLFMIFYQFIITESTTSKPKMAPVVKIKLEDLPPPPSDNMDAAPPPPVETIVNTGPAARAGTPVPVPDAEIKPDMKEFATMEVMSRASAEGGDGVDLGNFAANIDTDVDLKVQDVEEEPDPYEFVFVEQEPVIDYEQLQKLIVYPEMAIRANIEGTVTIRVLVGKDGLPKKLIIEDSDNSILDKAAKDAILKSKFTPAIQNKSPTQCWISIPVRFRLREG